MSGKYPVSPFSLLLKTYFGKQGIQTIEGHHNNPLSLRTCTNVNFSNGFSRLERSYLCILLYVEGWLKTGRQNVQALVSLLYVNTACRACLLKYWGFYGTFKRYRLTVTYLKSCKLFCPCVCPSYFFLSVYSETLPFYSITNFYKWIFHVQFYCQGKNSLATVNGLCLDIFWVLDLVNISTVISCQ